MAKKMEKVAVIGSNSFSGAHFVNHLLENTDYGVVGISRSSEYNPIFLPYKDKEENRFKFYKKDLNKDVDNLIDLFNKEDVNKVVNFAAQGMVGESWDNPLHWYRTNVLGVISLVERLKERPNFQKYVQISTPEVYGSCEDINEKTLHNPSTPYANSKGTADIHIKLINKQFDFPANFVRSTNVYGPCQQLFRIIPRTIIYNKLGKKIQLHNEGKSIKSYIHIKDVCEGILRIMETKDSGEVYHLSPRSGCSIRNIVQKICNKTGKNFNEVTENIGERVGQDKVYIIDSSKARKKLEWKPIIDLDRGLEQCVEWVNKNWEVVKTLPLKYIHQE